MPVTKIDLKDAGDFFDKRVSKAIRDGARKGMLSAALRMVNIIQTQIIPSIVPEPSARGHYKAGWRAGQESDDIAYYENTVPHAAFIEYGVRPSNVKVSLKMVNALAEWVTIKGIASGPAATRIAWAIANGMQTKGIFGNGLRVMERANKQLVSVLEEEVQREVERALG